MWQRACDEPDALGESPFWHPQEQCLYWVDIPGLRIRRQQPGAAVQTWLLDQEPGCIAPAAGGGLVMALRDGIYRARAWGGALEPIARFSHGGTSRFNDGKADPLGRFWAGTLYEPRDARKADLYSIDCRPGNGEGGRALVQLKAHNATTANGLAWSPDARTLYWTDTPRHLIHAWDWDARANVLSAHRIFHQFAPRPEGWQPGDAGYGGRPDGAAVDVQGNYWCAMYEGGRVVQLSPEGKLLREIEVPAQCPTMPCFGGVQGTTMYLSTARQGRPPEELAAWPLSGHMLALELGVAGLPVNFFID